jgi:D-serine deaminase-like pyridoxal phosphate-dependent protein
VACLSEAVAVRKAGLEGEILVLAYTAPEFVETLTDFDITQAIIDPGHAAAMNEAAKSARRTLKCHLKLETGMNRIGFRHDTPEQLETLAGVYGYSNLRFTAFSATFHLPTGRPGQITPQCKSNNSARSPTGLKRGASMWAFAICATPPACSAILRLISIWCASER